MIRFISRAVALGAMLALLASVQCFASCLMRSCDGQSAPCHHKDPQSSANSTCPFAHFALDQRVEAAPVSASLVIALLIQFSATAILAPIDYSFIVRASTSPPILPPSILVLRV